MKFKSFDGTGDDILPQKVMKSGDTLTIPDAPKENYYFLGWAEAPSAGKAISLYVPDGYDAIQNKLNVPDQGYLGYAVKAEHEIQNVTTGKTLYAVYYQKLKATERADAANPTDQEFIWNDAIWRVINTRDEGTKRLVIKFNALTNKEGAGITDDTENDVFTTTFNKGTQFPIGYSYFNLDLPSGDGGNGYDASAIVGGLKQVIDDYYATLADTAAVQGVDLNNPDLSTFLGPGFEGTIGSALKYNNWGWALDENGHYIFFQDNRFETKAGSIKQAFALSYGDIHGAMGVPTTAKNTNLLFLSGAKYNGFWFRSPGYYHNNAGYIYNGTFGQSTSSYDVYGSSMAVRPSLYLSVD